MNAQAIFDQWRATGLSIPSILSLFLEFRFGETKLAAGTGFLVEFATGQALVTARHNVTGKHQATGDYLHSKGGLPDNVVIHLPGLQPMTYVAKVEKLVDEDGGSLWIEHPQLADHCDVVILRLTDTAETFPISYSAFKSAEDIAVGPSEQVSVIGFPMGHSGGGMLPIWCSGYVASEPGYDYAGKPQFLIDCRTRQGQSGSPVIAFRTGQYSKDRGGFVFNDGPVWRRLGVYTGRIHPEADVGVVWKWQVVEELRQALEVDLVSRVRQIQHTHAVGSSEFNAELAKLGLKLN